MPTSKEDMIGVAVDLYNQVQSTSKSPQEVINTIKALSRAASSTPEGYEASQNILLVKYLWCGTGLHQIRMGHKMLAALLASSASPSIANCVKPPWPVFHIELPSDFLYLVNDVTACRECVTGVTVAYEPWHMDIANGVTLSPGWRYITYTREGGVWTHSGSTEYIGESAFTKDNAYTPFEGATSDDTLTYRMLCRLILNTCLAMSDPTNIRSKPAKPRPHYNGPSYKRNGQPDTQTYVLGREHIIDVREVVRDYLMTGKVGKGLTVQVLVAGHYKLQHYGPNNTQSKVIWIEPYRKGPEDAPVLVSTGVLR